MDTFPANGQQKEEKQTASRSDYVLPGSILIAAIMISGSLIYTATAGRGTPSPAPAGPTAEDGGSPVPAGAIPVIGGRDVILGEENAPVAIIEYGDFQCPFCARLHGQVSPLIREQYIKAGKAKMVYRHFAFLGPESVAAAEASECAKDQGKFWAFHDALFAAETADGTEHNGNLNRALFVKIASGLGMDMPKFEACVDSRQYADEVAKETADAKQYGVGGTPATFVGGTFISGAQPWSAFKAAIDAALAAQ